MHVDLYEKFWMWLSGVLLALFAAAIIYTAAAQAIQPPSHVETIDPTTSRTDPRFVSLGVTETADGQQVVVMAQMFAFTPTEIRVTAGRPVTFRLTSPDVIHGFQIVGSNANTMVIPGYVSQYTITFNRPGEYLIVCNEYCGLGHHLMYGTLIVEAPGGEG